LLILLGYLFQWDWTGFNVYTVTIKSIAIRGTTLPTNITVYLPSKTLFDWLQLLFIPVVLAVAGFWFNQILKDRERESREDNQRETALQSYIDKMSELLEKQLRKTQPEEEMCIVARARTINVLRQLNPERKGYVIQFLSESHLLSTRIIDLSFSELSEANLYRAILCNTKLYSAGLFRAMLFKANLSLANLSETYLVKADLRGAKLCYANLTGADLREADLRGADLSEAMLEGVKWKGARVNQKKIPMRDPQREELLCLEPTYFPNEKIPIDCCVYDKLEKCQEVKNDQSSTPDTKRDLSYINLRYVDLSDRLLPDVILREAKLTESKLVQADLRRADLRRADLRGANLRGADLRGANLRGADLSKANLSKVAMSGVDLTRTILKHATGIAVEELEKAKSLKGATMPDGYLHP